LFKYSFRQISVGQVSSISDFSIKAQRTIDWLLESLEHIWYIVAICMCKIWKTKYVTAIAKS